MEITVEKIALIRDNYNPLNKNLNLDVDWSVEFMDTDQRDIKYDIVLKSEDHLNLNFKLSGLIKLIDFEVFLHQEFSEIIFHHACAILMKMISVTRQSNYMLGDKMNSIVSFNSTF